MPRASLRNIPSVDRILHELDGVEMPRPALVALIRRELATVRSEAMRSRSSIDATQRVRDAIDGLRRAKIQPVINGTGVIIHTNLGRSPLGASAIAAMSESASEFNNLEFDLTDGSRGGRAAYLEHLLATLCGAEAATVVNNCAAALVLVLRQFASTDPRREVIISRGELVQIGGGFRIPEILEVGGATLREIGTTNKTSISDYSRAINRRTALILKVHRSNFFMSGFVESPLTDQIAKIARKARLPCVEDLGSGAMFPTESLATGGTHEPTPAEVLRQGVDLVTFSGDKLLGGPQAGIIAGRAKMVAALKRHPLFRALRCDKLVLSALQETVELHLRGQLDAIPIIEMMRASIDDLRTRATNLMELLREVPANVSIGSCESQVGGGSLPQLRIASIAIEIRPRDVTPQELAARLRRNTPPIITTVSAGRVRIDLRTVFPRHDLALGDALRRCLSQ